MAPCVAAIQPSHEVSIVIPHYLGDVLLRCLTSVFEQTNGAAFEVIVADDQPFDDGTIGAALARWPDIRVVKVGGGRGFGAAVNRGIEAARAPLIVLLNNDAVVADGWLLPLLDAARDHPEAGAFQPKVLSLADPARFDYGGAAGGLIDFLGYPFALGRLFDVVEEDRGQHDEPREVFWAVGGAMLLRRSALDRTGLLDEAFYMHMEEIDLCWRMHLQGFTVRSVPASVVFHEGGHTLKTGSFKKTWLNHRNSLVLLLKNWTMPTLIWLFPTRCALEIVTIGYGLLRRDWKHPVAALLALAWVALHLPSIGRRRFPVQGARRVSDGRIMDRMYRGSIVFERFVRGAMSIEALPGPASVGKAIAPAAAGRSRSPAEPVAAGAVEVGAETTS